MDGRPARYYDEVHADASISVVAPTTGHVKLLTTPSGRTSYCFHEYSFHRSSASLELGKCLVFMCSTTTGGTGHDSSEIVHLPNCKLLTVLKLSAMVGSLMDL